jgi:hypothetical protein
MSTSMTSNIAKAPARTAFLSASFQAGLAAASHWRLLLLWVLLSLLPAALLALPFWLLLGASFDFSVHAATLAREIDMVALADVYEKASRGGAALPQAALLALLTTLVMSPFLTGMAISAARAELRPGFGALIAGGLQEYPRMARMLLVALLPLGLAALLGGAARGMAERYSEGALLASNAAMASLAASAVMALLLVLAHASIDAGRATLALDRRRRSAFKGWWQGCKLLARHPLRTLGAYLPVTVMGLLLAALLTLARMHLPGINGAGFFPGFLLTQLVVLVLAWMRTARLFAMIALARQNSAV